MSIVVSDTSPIRALDHLGELRLLREMFGQVIVPPEVARELREPRDTFRVIDVAGLDFFEIVSVIDKSQIDSLMNDLDAGEAEAIALACELKADAVLIDEHRGRRVAGQRKLRVIGTVGILLRAKSESLIPRIKPLLDSLMTELDFFLSPKLYQDALLLADEITQR